VKLYGIPASQASRCLWLLEELGLDYELEIVRPGEGTTSSGFAKLNPNQKIPVLEDGDLVLSESMAINLYLARTYPTDLWPDDPGDQARVLQWSFWVAHDVEPHLWRMWQQGDLQAREELHAGLETLEGVLSSRDWLVGTSFSVADLNLESYIIRARRGGYRLTDHQALNEWIERCEARPARRKVRQMIVDYESSADAR